MARAFSAELVHQRDITRQLVAAGVGAADRFEWQSQMRYYHDARADATQALTIAMADATFSYGWEYLGVGERLVQTPLTDRLYLAMTQALRMRLGGSPFGPAGTGKTESVKALGAQLGRFVLVFNCDESFDFQAMSRILVGLCRVGAWGCFDEFNRLEERILSAVSQQIQAIQLALRASSSSQEYVYVMPHHTTPHHTRDGDDDGDRRHPMPISNGRAITTEVAGRAVAIHADMAIFVTMNPGYAGRSNLPDNLKLLFRSFAMTRPDRTLIAQACHVMLKL
jgi:dynein heavy chain 1